MSQRVLRSFLSLTTGYIRTFASLIIGLIATPIILKHLGEEKFGLYRVLLDSVGYFGLFDLGFYGSMMTLFMRSLGKDSKEDTNSVFALGFRYYLRIAILSIVVGLGLSFFLDFIVKTSLENQSDVRWGFLILVGAQILVPFQTYRIYLESKQLGYIVNFASLILAIVTPVLSIIFAKMHMGVSGQSLAYFLGMFSMYIYMMIAAKLPLTEAFKRRENISLADIRQKFWEQQWPHLIGRLTGLVALLSDNIIISIIMGPKAVAPFFLSQKLSQVAQSQLQAISQATWAALGEIYNMGDFDLFNKRLRELTKLVTVLSGTLLIPIAALNESFIGLWVGEEQFAGLTPTLVFALNAFFLALLSLWSICFTSSGHAKALVPLVSLQTVINLSLSVWGTYEYGIIGPVLGTLMGYVLLPLWWLPLLMNRHYKTQMLKLTFSWLIPFLAACGFYIAFQYWLENFEVNQWWELIVHGGGAFTIFSLLSYLLLLNKEEKKLYKERIKKIVRR